jgi:hypothetical protein
MTARSFVLAMAAALLGGTLLSGSSWLAPGWITYSGEPLRFALGLYQVVLLVAVIEGAFALAASHAPGGGRGDRAQVRDRRVTSA